MFTDTPTATIRRMSTADLLTLTQWLSPAFPLGAFAYSHGLEQAVAAGEVRDADGLQGWLLDIVQLGAGRNDAVLLSMTHRGADAAEMAALARALAPTRERWEETSAQGRAFADTVTAMGHSVAPAALPVAVGQAARRLSLDTAQVTALYLHGFAANLVSAGVRFIPLGQTEGQVTLGGLHGAIDDLAAWAATAGRDDLGGATIRADLGAALHETMDVRIFRS
ncbi:urease accessory protein UreF [Aliiroseovarius sp. PTFE2010]|uniref:urease accessory protein UreF n=1 Tax=Aliiroseovarius sp. PTFE2010 TaxID=3417190 RepID=UPI003CE82EBD